LRTPEQWPATHRAYGVGDGAFYAKHVRCGDVLALRLGVRQLARMSAREALHALHIRRRGASIGYVRGFVEGLRGSLNFGVDRRRRMYVAPLAVGT
jgi:hypothetical protein